jgi:hypothetical protein
MSTRKEKAMTETNHHFSPRATLAAIGLKIRAMDLLDPIKEKVKIAQKKIKYDPLDKLLDALITILAGAHGLSEINTRLRSDPALSARLRQGSLRRSVRRPGYTQRLHSHQCGSDDAGAQRHLSET